MDIDDFEEEPLDPPVVWNIGLEGHTWNIDRYYEAGRAMPEKFELIQGKLFWSERERLGMLSAMLEQVGLAAAVRLAPKELWLEAVRQLDS
jgi:hypothetical protein